MAQVRFENVWKRYGDFVAVRDLNLTLPEGDFTVLVGPSGCGKTTSLRMIAGLEDISEGDLYIGDKRVNDLPPRERDIAMVFQSYALYPHMTVYENMAFGLRVRKLPKDEIDRRVRGAAETLGITELLGRKPAAMSGGQRQRVAMGRAIVRNPRVFLFDEPLSNLDAKLRGQMRIELSRLHQRLSATVVYVTHDQLEAMTLADHIIVMKAGVVQQHGPPREVYMRPANRFVAGFIGSPPMNFFTGRIEGGRIVGEGVSFEAPEGLEEGRGVHVGIRPEDLQPAAGETVALTAPVEVVELLGAEALAYLNPGTGPVIVRLPGDATLREGDTLELTADPDRLHLFDDETEERIDAQA